MKKTVKSVEFGAKVNKVQIDGISFIDHINFNAFNEGKRFIKTVQNAKVNSIKRKIASGDNIYTSNKNRT